MAKKKAAKKITSTKKQSSAEQVAPVSQNPSIFGQYLRFGESYTSLILGIIVVIVATVLLLAFVQNRQAGAPQEEEKQLTLKEGEVDKGAVATTSASVTPAEATVTVTPQPTKQPTSTSTPKPTATTVPTMTPTVTPRPQIVKKQTGDEKTYTVVAGDNLWIIAEKTYKSGYNWVDIARANNLNDPSDIHVGNKLILPKVSPRVATVSGKSIEQVKKVAPQRETTSIKQGKKITGETYKIAHGDTLWDIAVRAYGDGYQWVRIADANKLTENPGLIHVDNTIKIPRK